MSESTTAFFRELAKIKLAKLDLPWLNLAGLNTGFGAATYLRNRPRDDGRSAPEQKSLAALQQPGLEGEEQIKALKKHKGNVAAEERAGAIAATSIGALVGYGGQKLLSKSNRAKDVGHTTSPEVAEALYRASMPVGPEIDRQPGIWAHRRPDNSGVFYMNSLGRGQSQHIPKGGNASWLERAKEEQALKDRKMPPGWIDYGYQHGATILPGGGNPHIAAHELGHAQFSAKPYAKFLRRANMPLGIATSIGSELLAARADPDSTTAKLAPAVAALGLAPMLGEEAYASIKGLQAMRKAGLPPEVIRHGAAQGARAWGAYAMKYGLPAVAAPYIIRKVRQYRMAQRQKAGLETSRDVGNQIDAMKSGE